MFGWLRNKISGFLESGRRQRTEERNARYNIPSPSPPRVSWTQETVTQISTVRLSENIQHTVREELEGFVASRMDEPNLQLMRNAADTVLERYRAEGAIRQYVVNVTPMPSQDNAVMIRCDILPNFTMSAVRIDVAVRGRGAAYDPIEEDIKAFHPPKPPKITIREVPDGINIHEVI